ncbi:MAG: type II secretion system protein GspN [Deltaproteobacteria bacterium]|nr:type II secretion system protein GspN [Deltaproteobacteria bacterium]
MKKQIGLKILGLALFFIVMLFVFFPIDNLKGYIFEQVYKESGVLLRSDSIYFSSLGLPGIGMKNVNVTIPIGDQEIDLWSERVTLRTAITGFFPPLPGVSLKISDLKNGGDIYTKIGKGGSSISFYLEGKKINLEQIGSKSAPPLKGTLNINSDILLNETDVSQSAGYFKIDVENMFLNQQNISPPDPSMAAFSFIIPAMKIGKLKGLLKMKNGLLEISQFKFGEDSSADFKGSVNGEFKVEKSFEQSAMTIALRLQLSQRILENPEAKTFVTFLSSYQTSPGEYGLKWSATVQDFTNFSIKAIPEKLNP